MSAIRPVTSPADPVRPAVVKAAQPKDADGDNDGTRTPRAATKVGGPPQMASVGMPGNLINIKV
jgi:hypothetical protein